MMIYIPGMDRETPAVTYCFVFSGPDVFVKDGDFIKVGDLSFQVLFTPGHCPGHCVFYSAQQGLLFAGDLVFDRNVGRTDFAYCDPAAMTRSLARVAELPPRTMVFPGHMNPTTIGEQLRVNSFLRQAVREASNPAKVALPPFPGLFLLTMALAGLLAYRWWFAKPVPAVRQFWSRSG
eukprot:RCo022758